MQSRFSLSVQRARDAATNVFVVGLLLWSASSQALTGAVLESEVGDSVGEGVDQTFSQVTVSGTASGLVANFGDYVASFGPPKNLQLGTGRSFGDVTGNPMYSEALPTFFVIRELGLNCHRLTGWFKVREAVYTTAGAVDRLAIDFKQTCDGSSASLYGAVRYNSTIPLDAPKLAAVGMQRQQPATRETVLLDGSRSILRGVDPGAAHFAWTQLSGSPVSLKAVAGSNAEFVAPFVPPGGEDLTFQLQVSANGVSDTDVVKVHISSRADPQTSLLFQSEAGDPIGNGKTFRFTPRDGVFRFDVDPRQDMVQLVFTGTAPWHLDFMPPNGVPFTVGVYENAKRTFGDTPGPGMAVSGNFIGCNTVRGRFTVIDIKKSVLGEVERLALDYEQYCDSHESALRGAIRFNYVPPGVPRANAGEDFRAKIGSTVQLNGVTSSDDKAIVTYRWRQLSGTPVILSAPNAANASFTAPQSPDDLQFELMVVDADDFAAVDTVTVKAQSELSLPGRQGGGSSSTSFVLAMLLLWGYKKSFHRPHNQREK